MKENYKNSSLGIRLEDDMGLSISHDGIKRSLTTEEANEQVRKQTLKLIKNIKERSSASLDEKNNPKEYEMKTGEGKING